MSRRDAHDTNAQLERLIRLRLKLSRAHPVLGRLASFLELSVEDGLAHAVESGAQAVLTGNCGPKAFKVLEAAKIPVAVGLSGTVREVLRQYKENKVSYAQGPNVEGHW